jgi:DNA-binding NarL/FixJ family response regulator
MMSVAGKISREVVVDEAVVDIYGMKILLVEGSEPVRQSMKKLLAVIADAEIIGEAETSGAALQLIEKLQPEVVIMGVVLKGGSGFDVLKEIRNREYSPMVIILTNYASSPFRKKALQAGADFFFDKSTEFEKVVEVLKQKSAVSNRAE